ncbi:MAG: hypothetical protein PHP45_00860 [Elusimicrobiales bacterium]|nr:hypothetical protein [Elusimicrobiales bacterium]
MKHAIIALFLTAACAAGAGALEISLEENRGASGSVGFVDMERVFKEHPETVKAREEFSLLLKDKKAFLGLKREELSALRQKLAVLSEKRKEFVRRAKEAEAAPAVSTAASAGAPVSTASVSGAYISAMPAIAPAQGPAVSSAAVPVPVSTAAVVTTETASPVYKTAVAAGTATVSGQNLFDAGAQAVAVSSGAECALPLSADTDTLEGLDGAISTARSDISAREALLKDYRKKTEKELVDLEGKRSEIILGKIYFALRELAIAEHLSVVVDKKSTLYGQNAVDLTSKLLDKLSCEEQERGAP